MYQFEEINTEEIINIQEVEKNRTNLFVEYDS